MFRKILIVAMFATAAGYCFAADNVPQIVTSEVFYSGAQPMDDMQYDQNNQYVQQDIVVEEVVQNADEMAPVPVPVWPLAGSDADVTVACEDGLCEKDKQQDNIRIVSKIGTDLVVENNFNMGVRGDFMGWSGGANMLHGNQVPAGFDNECDGSEMPLLQREMLEDDGGTVLTVSRSNRRDCNKYSDGYTAFAARMGVDVGQNGKLKSEISVNEKGEIGMQMYDETTDVVLSDAETEIAVNVTADAEPKPVMIDQVRSWVVANGQTLREVLQNWADKEGWDLVWATSREYPIEASAVFKGRFVDVASALVRNFARATPVPYAKFYKGNRVLVISTSEE